MEIEELKAKALSITNPALQSEELYELLDLLNIKYRKTKCYRCRIDLYNIILEELGLIKDAAESSSFNYEYKYLKSRSVLWNHDGKMVKINQNTPMSTIEEFIKTHKGFYKKIDK